MRIHEIDPPGTVATPSARTSVAAIENYLEEELPLHAERWREDFINWIVHDDITFEQAASTRLRSVIINGGPKVRHLLPCARTVRTWVLNTYNERISEVVAALARSRSKINLSLDAWSSSNNQSLLGVCGHWINEYGQFITALLALRPLDGHDGTDIAQVLHGVISTFNLEAKLGAFQMDNADTNDTALRALCTLLPTEHRFDPNEARLRCFGHIVNLVVKALLFGEGTSRLQKELQDAGDKEAFAIWRKQGAIGHLHNIVTYIARSPKRLKAFEAIQKVDASDFSLRLIKDLGVRWNSTYSMIHRAIQLKEKIKYYCKHWRKAPGEQYDLTADFLDREAWNELEHYDELLAPFATATKRIEGNAYTGSHGALWECIPTMDYLFFELKERADEVTAEKDLFSDHFRHCLNHGYSKLYHYYNVIDKSRLYAASVALHPCMKYSYIEEHWPRTNGREAIDVAKEQVQSLFDEYLAKHRPTSPTPALAPAQAAALPAPVDAYKRFLSSTLRSRQDNLNRRLNKHDLELQRFMDDELDTSLITYVNGVSVEGDYFDEPLRWWRERGESSYPILAAMAYDLFSLPGMSSECERSFSAAKRMITDTRYQLKTDIIEADQCVKSWFKHGLANGQHAFTNIADLEEVAAEIAAPAIVTL